MTAPVVEFVVTGDEVMRGLIADTNTAMTAARLYPLGLSLRRTTVVGDREEDIRRALGIKHNKNYYVGARPIPLTEPNTEPIKAVLA